MYLYYHTNVKISNETVAVYLSVTLSRLNQFFFMRDKCVAGLRGRERGEREGERGERLGHGPPLSLFTR